MKRTLILLLALLAACSQSPKASEDAIRRALMQYLGTKQGLALDKMDVQIAKVQITGDKADADVSFRVKGSVSQGMDMRYSLHRGPEGWVVDRSDSVSGHPTTSGGPKMGTPSGELPPGHPTVNPPTQKN